MPDETDSTDETNPTDPVAPEHLKHEEKKREHHQRHQHDAPVTDPPTAQPGAVPAPVEDEEEETGGE